MTSNHLGKLGPWDPKASVANVSTGAPDSCVGRERGYCERLLPRGCGGPCQVVKKGSKTESEGHALSPLNPSDLPFSALSFLHAPAQVVFSCDGDNQRGSERSRIFLLLLLQHHHQHPDGCHILKIIKLSDAAASYSTETVAFLLFCLSSITNIKILYSTTRGSPLI